MCGAAIGAVAGLGSAMIGSNASDDASDAVREGQQESIGYQRETRDLIEGYLQPYMGAGTAGLGELMWRLGLKPGSSGGGYGGGRSLQQITQQLQDSGKYEVGGGKLIRDKMGRDVTDKYTNMMNAAAWPVIWASMENDGYKMEDSGQTNWDALNKEAMRMFESQSGGSNKGRDAGTFGTLLKPFGLEDFYTDPGYQFRQEQGEKALERGAAARGLAQSTPGMQELMDFNSGLASQEFGAAFGRDAHNKQFTLGALSGLVGIGQDAVGTLAGSQHNAASAMSSAAMSGAGAQAQIGMAGASGVNRGIQGGLANYMYANQMKQGSVFKPMNPGWGGEYDAGRGFSMYDDPNAYIGSA